MPTRAAIVAEARRWLGTPYHHQASALGAGADCIGLVRGVYRALLGREPAQVPGYGRDWAEATGAETLLDAARRHLVEIDPATIRAGDILLFRWRPHLPAKHAGITGARPRPGTVAPGTVAPPEPTPGEGSRPPSSRLTLVHALEAAAVVEVPLVPWWRRRIAGAFAFPDP